MNLFFKYLLINILYSLLISFPIFGQDTLFEVKQQRYYHTNGTISSEGGIKDGKPEGYWRSYYENGRIKSEGNRKNFELDSLWKFYNVDGKLVLEINYSQGKKNGLKVSYIDKEIIHENFINDVKEGYARYYYPDGKIKQEIPFVHGLEQGFGKEYADDGTIVTLTEYKRGYLIDRLRINRRDENGLKQGRWYLFYPGGRIQTEGVYKNDKKNGYFKEYSENGDLLKVSKYVDDVLQTEAQEIQKPEIQKTYYPNGNIKVSAMFRNGIQEGLQQMYDSTGKIEKSQVFQNGKVIGEGIIKEDGKEEGPWKNYYPDGSIKSFGNYAQGEKTGEWKYYHANGKLEQSGRYNLKGRPEGMWRWYYDSGQLFKEEEYHNGVKDGLLVVYDETGMIIEEGEYYSGNEEGPWVERIGDTYIKGTYRDGLRNGMWYYYYLDYDGVKWDSLCFFKGNFVEDNPDGNHVYYWENGNKKDEGRYMMGKKEGDWYKYNYDGTLFIIITYRDGIEIRYDGIRIKPPFEKEEE